MWIFESKAPRQAEHILLTAVVRWLQRTGVQEPARSLPPAADIVREYAQSLRNGAISWPALLGPAPGFEFEVADP